MSGRPPAKPWGAFLLAVLGAFFSLLSIARAQAASNDAAEKSSEEERKKARERFTQARRDFEEGNYERAAQGFDAAYRIRPHASPRFNAAVSWDKAEQPARAADAYESALEMGGLQRDDAAEARTRLGALKKTLGYVRILEPVGALVSLAHVERAPVPVRVHVSPGAYTAVIEGTDVGQASERIRVGAGEVVTVSASLESARPARPKPANERRESADRELSDAPPEDGEAQRVWGYIAIGGGVLLSGAAIWLGVNALKERDEFEDSGRVDVSARDRSANLRTWTNVAWGGAAVSGLGGLYLVLSAPTVRF